MEWKKKKMKTIVCAGSSPCNIPAGDNAYQMVRIGDYTEALGNPTKDDGMWYALLIDGPKGFKHGIIGEDDVNHPEGTYMRRFNSEKAARNAWAKLKKSHFHLKTP